MNRGRILVFIDWFTPAYKAGGPIKSIANFAEYLKEWYDIYIYTSDRDLGMTKSFENVPLNSWINISSNLHVIYNTPNKLTKSNINEAVSFVQPNFIYINSIFSKHFSIDVLLIKNNYKQIKYILAPRGMLKKTALAFKPIKKYIFLKAAQIKNLYNNITFHATDSTEVSDIKKNLSWSSMKIEEVGNCPAKFENTLHFIKKEKGVLKLIFIGRIHKIKNLDYLLNLLHEIKYIIELNIVGVLEDQNYWEECKLIIESLPKNIQVHYLNAIPPEKLNNFIKENHLLILPTQGENFGHVIYESLAASRPVLISDQTPWLHLSEDNAGWEFPLNKPEKFVEKINYFASLNQEEYNKYCDGSLGLAYKFYNNSNLKKKYFKIFS